MVQPIQGPRGGLFRHRALPAVHRQGDARPGALQPAARPRRRRAGRHLGLPAGLPAGPRQAQRAARPLPERQHPHDQEAPEQRHLLLLRRLKQVKIVTG